MNIHDDHIGVIHEVHEFLRRESVFRIQHHGLQRQFLLMGSEGENMAKAFALHESRKERSEGGFPAGVGVVGDDNQFFHRS